MEYFNIFLLSPCQDPEYRQLFVLYNKKEEYLESCFLYKKQAKVELVEASREG